MKFLGVCVLWEGGGGVKKCICVPLLSLRGQPIEGCYLPELYVGWAYVAEMHRCQVRYLHSAVVEVVVSPLCCDMLPSYFPSAHLFIQPPPPAPNALLPP
jgi:hypothetical protein